MTKQLLAAVLIGVACHFGAAITSTSAQAQPASAKTLVALFDRLEPWSHTKTYSPRGWAFARRVAKTVQTTNPKIVDQALDAFMANAVKATFNGDSEDESKVYLLMRVVFDLPENAAPSKSFSYKGWDNAGQSIQGGTANLAWPLKWNGGHPTLVIAYEGSEGIAYGAKAEYGYMLAHFPFRQL
jgi:hypothetical protein